MMHDAVLRPWAPDDLPALKALWRIGFGDGDDVIDAFHNTFLVPGSCIAAEADGRLVSAMYILMGQRLTTDRRQSLSAGYAYALATLPEYRGRGIGTAVYRACCDKILESADIACVLPAGAPLYPLYEAAGAFPVSYVREAHLSRAEVADAPSSLAARFSPLEYARTRESFLSGLPHASFGAEFFEYMEETGTEFFALENGLAAIDIADGVCYIRELLVPGPDVMRCIGALARWCRAEEYTVNTPVFFDGPGEIRPHVLGITNTPQQRPIPDDFWWGLGLE